MYGTARSSIAGMVKGVTDGYVKELEIQGVGFKANLKGKQLDLALGYSHPILHGHPRGHQGHRHRPDQAQGRGRGQAARRCRHRRNPRYYPPEPYKGKGVRIVGERVRRKEGKTVA